MKPALYRSKTPYEENKPQAWLVDEASVVEVVDGDGRVRKYYSQAVDLGHVMAGTFDLIIKADNPEGEFSLIHPRPCLVEVFDAFDGNVERVNLEKRGLRKEAAVALLNLAGAQLNTQYSPVFKGWSKNKPAKKDVPIPWSEHKFFAAWMWSEWEWHDHDSELRHAMMKRFGYEKSAGALRQMCSRMGLVTFKRS